MDRTMTALQTADVHGKATAAASDHAAEAACWSAGTLCGLLASVAVLVVWRRLAGALDTPLEPAAFLAVGLVLAATACGVRLLWQRLSAAAAGRIMPRSLLLSAALFVMGLSLSLPGTPVGGLLAFWVIVAAEEFWAWRLVAWRDARGPCVAVAAPPVEPKLQLARDEFSPPPFAADDIPPQDVLQQLTRSQAADGSDVLAGWLRMAFVAGQRTGSLHVAFCPPFAKTPELTVEQVDGPDARVKTAHLLPYGVRLDLKLAATPAAAAGVLLQFSARSEGQEVGCG
jgi:hypothetical protein